MASTPSKYHTRMEEVQDDQTLKPEEGWKLAIRWLISEHRLGSQFGAVGYAVLPPGGGAHELHVHDNAEEVAVYLKGRGLRICGDEQFEIGPGDIAFTPVGTPHSLHNLSDAEPIELLCIYLGAPSVEKTGYRLVK